MGTGEEKFLRHGTFGASRVTNNALADAPLLTGICFNADKEFRPVPWLRVRRRATGRGV